MVMEISVKRLVDSILNESTNEFQEDLEMQRSIKSTWLLRTVLSIASLITPLEFQSKNSNAAILRLPTLVSWPAADEGAKRIKNPTKHNQVKSNLICLFATYVIIKLIIIATLHIQLKPLMIEWEGRHEVMMINNNELASEQGAYSSLNCSHPIDYRRDARGSILRNRIIENFFWLRLLGSPTTGENNLLVFVTLQLCITVSVVMVVALFSGNHNLQSLNFQLNPFQERQRIGSDLVSIIRDCLWSKPIHSKISSKNNHNNHTLSLCGYNDKKCLCWSEKRKDRLLLTKQSINSVMSITPANLSLMAYKRLISIQYTVITLAIIIGLSICYITTKGMFYDELIRRILWHVRILHCKEQYDRYSSFNNNINNNESIHHSQSNESIFLAQIDGIAPLNETEGRDYLQLRRTSMGSLILCWRYEIRHMLKPQTIILITEFTNLSIMIGFWISIYFYLFESEIISRKIWTNQIERQLKRCATIMDYSQELELAVAEQQPNQDYCRLMINRRLIRIRQSINKCLLVTYFNFELYRREQPQFLAYIGFCAFQLTISSLSATMISYCLIFDIFDKSKINEVASLILIYFTLFELNFFRASKFGEEVQRIYKLIGSLVCRISTSNRFSSHSTNRPLANLWQRQLMDDSDVKRIYSVQILGIPLDANILISINSYIFAAIIYIHYHLY